MTAEQIRDALIAYLDEHEARCDLGPNCKERFNLMGFLCHCAGVHHDDLGKLQACILEYDRTCPGCAACARTN